MRSIRWWRRLTSDHGFEGILDLQNLMRIRKGILFVSGICMLVASSSTWIARSKPCDPMRQCVIDAQAKRLDPDRQLDDLKLVVIKKLSERDLSWVDLVNAATHLVPIESQLLEVYRVDRELRTIPKPVTREKLQKILHDLRTLPSVRTLIETKPPSVMDPDATRDVLVSELINDWISRGYFDDNTHVDQGVFGNRQTSECLGVDIGTKMVPSISEDQSLQHLPVDQYEKGVEYLQQLGCVLVRNAVNEDTLRSIRDHLCIHGQPSSDIGKCVLALDANISHSRASPNRLQMVLRGSKVEEFTSKIHSAIFPVVCAIQEKRNFREKLILSDLRLVVVDHAAQHLRWTAYNPRGGLSVMIPLQTHDSRSATQIFLPGSHLLLDPKISLFRRWSMFLERYLSFASPQSIPALYLDGSWKAGDAFVFDNRLLIRGDENRLFRSGAYILAKYETVEDAPMTLFLRGKYMFRLAQFLEIISPYSRQ